MTDNSLSAYAPPPVVASAGFSIWAPGLWLMRHLGLRCKLLVLLLSAWLPLLLALAVSNLPEPRLGIAGLDLLRGLVDGVRADPRFAAGRRWARWPRRSWRRCTWRYALASLRGAGCCCALACAEPVSRSWLRTDELGQGYALAGRADARHGSARCRARELADAHLAMQLEALEVRSAVAKSPGAPWRCAACSTRTCRTPSKSAPTSMRSTTRKFGRCS